MIDSEKEVTDSPQDAIAAEEHPMETAAVHAVAQGWCEPETEHYTMDPTLARAIVKPVTRALKAWYKTARLHAQNEEYYRGLVREIGELVGEEAFRSDDGSMQQDVLCAKVPELVRAHFANGVSGK